MSGSVELNSDLCGKATGTFSYPLTGGPGGGNLGPKGTHKDNLEEKLQNHYKDYLEETLGNLRYHKSLPQSP